MAGFSGKPAFGYATGRRRVGKTALLVEVCREKGGLYHQAVEGTPQQQLEHVVEEWQGVLPLIGQVRPKTWSEFFSLLAREKLPPMLVFDEFPYWVQSDSTLPSVLQKWIDHELPKKKTFVCVSGSSQSMLFSQFLNPNAPLYGRTQLHLHVNPMSYRWFCHALGYDAAQPLSFARFSLVGGIPHYWKLMPKGTLLEQVDALYFEPSAYLSEEPRVILQDEGVTGLVPKAILDLVGRGVSKPSEIAARLGMPQGNLSRPLALLQEIGMLQKELPYGESARTTKKVNYSLNDPALSFYYKTYLPHRGHWAVLSSKQRQERIDHHASRFWEIYCRQSHPSAGRYWEGDVEIDIVAPLEGGKTLIAECKWSKVSQAEEKSLLADLQNRFEKTQLSSKIRQPAFKIFSQKDLPALARQERE